MLAQIPTDQADRFMGSKHIMNIVAPRHFQRYVLLAKWYSQHFVKNQVTIKYLALANLAKAWF